MTHSTQQIGSFLAERREKAAEAARLISEMLAEFPELEADLRKLFSHGEPAASPKARTDARPKVKTFVSKSTHGGASDVSNFDRVADFFLTTGNKLIATPEISGAAGIPALVVNNVLWSARGKRLFERHAHPSNKKVKMWKLTESEFTKRVMAKGGK